MFELTQHTSRYLSVNVETTTVNLTKLRDSIVTKWGDKDDELEHGADSSPIEAIF
jgi:hypothetical protein